MADIFLSYAREDLEAASQVGFADTLAAALMKEGGGKVMISMEVEQRDDEDKVIDVTPRPIGQGLIRPSSGD